jgi:ATP-binding protein involved in chromosome partitioning
MALTSSEVLASLDGVSSPEGLPLSKTDVLSDILVADGKVFFSITVNAAVVQAWEPVRKRAEAAVKAIPGVTSVMVALTAERKAGAAAPAAPPQQRRAGPAGPRAPGPSSVQGVGAIIAVASGKGGVGKSTTAVNLALALAAEGATVGMLDADIYGPSQPLMLGITGRPTSRDGKTMEPMEGHGVQAMSVGFLIEQDTPMVWRGPMVTQALEQLLTETKWRDLDYLVVDLPPGTGDIQLTLAQKVPVTGAVIVTTPQDIALIDARKGLKMFEKVGIPILGVVENMAIHICSNCGHAEHIFGSGGGEKMCKDYDVELLGSLPLDIRIREQADSGKPTVVADPEGAIAAIYRDIARKVAARIARQSEDRSSVFPKIVIQNT